MQDYLLLERGLLLPILLRLLHGALGIRLASGLCTRVILLLSQDVFYLFHLLENEDHFGLSFPDFEGVCSVLLVKFDQGLFELQNFFVGEMNFSHHVFFLLFIKLPFFTLTIARRYCYGSVVIN